MKKHFSRLVLSAFVLVLTLGLVLSDSVFAGRYYPGKVAQCIADSGVIMWSVEKYACPKAAEKPQNACATWLGPTNNYNSFAIFASSVNDIVPLNFWGMCTDRANTSSTMEVLEDNDSIADGNAYNFTRSGTWGSPSSKGTTLNVAKFIQGLSPIVINGHTGYRRRVAILRAHSDGASADWDYSWIWVEIGGTPVIPPPEKTPEQLCKEWMPSSYANANEMHGTTTIDIRIKNTAERFGGIGFGDWNTGTIYAMPTDKVLWNSCYYGGTPGTAHTEVTDVNGGSVYWGYGYKGKISDSYCQYESNYTDRGVGDGITNSVPITNLQLYAVSPIWENKWNIWGAGGSAGGSYAYDRNKEAAWRNGYQTVLGDAGGNFSEDGKTGAPKSVDIGGGTEYTTISGALCPLETDYSRPVYPYTKCAFEYMGICYGGYVTDYDRPEYPYFLPDRWDCPACHNEYTDTLRVASVDYSPHTDNANVLVPYNYVNFTGVQIGTDDPEGVFSGETLKVDHVWTEVTPRDNGVTAANYATQVPGAKLKLFGYVTSAESGGGISYMETTNDDACDILGGAAKQCLEFKSESGLTLNGGASLDGAKEKHWNNKSYNAFDASAGDYLCLVSAVWPSESAGDTDMSTGGNGRWRYSMPSCVLIVKKPSFQVWGDSMYSVGGVEANIARKRNLYSYYSSDIKNRFHLTGGGPLGVVYVGSWVEEALNIKSGYTLTMASGAALGKNSNVLGAGNNTENVKNISPLTFANAYVANRGMGGSNIGSLVTASNREDLLNYWVKGATDKGSCGSVWGGTCRRMESATGKNIYYVTGGNMSIGGTIPQNTTYLVKATGNITITSDLKYANANYTLIGQVPKVIIYTSGSAVNIYCGVNEVDAIIIAPNAKTNTCSNVGYEEALENRIYTDPARERQLKVFGTLMTKSIELGRTYGGAAWNKSRYPNAYADVQPAEVFDYDSTLMMWSEFMGGAAETDTLQTVYQHELAPRY